MKNAIKKETHNTCTTEVNMDKIRIEYPAENLRFFRIRIEFGYLFVKKLDQDRNSILVGFL